MHRNSSFHPANLKLQPFPHWRVMALSKIAEILGVQFHINGIPFGAEYRANLWFEVDDSERVSADTAPQ